MLVYTRTGGGLGWVRGTGPPVEIGLDVPEEVERQALGLLLAGHLAAVAVHSRPQLIRKRDLRQPGRPQAAL